MYIVYINFLQSSVHATLMFYINYVQKQSLSFLLRIWLLGM